MIREKRRAPQWAVAQRELIRQMNGWIAEAQEREAKIPWLGITDELTFMLSWAPHYFLTGDEPLKEFMFGMRDRWQDWADRNFLHGYFLAHAEEHHHTENYARFLARLWYLDPHDPRNVRPIEHFAHHLGNWVGGIPPWYDWKRHCFVGRFLGTTHVSDAPEHRFNSPSFCRYLVILIQAYLMTGESRYLELCRDYVDRWWRLLESAPDAAQLPQKVDLDWKVLESDPAGYEWIAGGFVSVATDLFLLTQDERYARAVKTVLGRLVGQKGPVYDPYGAVSAYLGAYRMATGDCSFDSRVLAAARAVRDSHPPTVLLGQGSWPEQKLAWASQGGPKTAAGRAGPGSLLCLAYQITGDVKYVARALRIAARRLELARSIGCEGRTHGCSAGHANETVLSDTLTVLYPAAMGMAGVAARGAGHHKPLVTYRKEDGTLGLPDGVAALFHFRNSAPHKPDTYTVSLANVGDEPCIVRVIAHDGLMRRRIHGLPWVIARQGEPRYGRPAHPWEEIASASLLLQPGEERTVTLPAPLRESRGAATQSE